LTAPAGVLEWTEEAVSLSQVERALGRLRDEAARDGSPPIRTSVMTHMAWVPEAWVEQARGALAGMAEAHPSRTILLFPEPDSGRNQIDATVSLGIYAVPGADRSVCSEVVELRLHGPRAKAPASIVMPLLIADLPVFLRWRGEPPWRSQELEQLIDVTDRLIVASTEWDDLPYPYRHLTELFDRAACSDIAWARTSRWRTLLASLWPEIEGVRTIRVHGTQAQGLLLAGWLRSRLRKHVDLVHRPGRVLRRVALDGEAIAPPPGDGLTPSDLLSEQLDVFGRDPVYEAAVAAVSQS